MEMYKILVYREERDNVYGYIMFNLSGEEYEKIGKRLMISDLFNILIGIIILGYNLNYDIKYDIILSFKFNRRENDISIEEDLSYELSDKEIRSISRELISRGFSDTELVDIRKCLNRLREDIVKVSKEYIFKHFNQIKD